MRRRLAPALVAISILAVAAALGGCGAEEEHLEVVEGEPIEADEVSYNVVISRFLNPEDAEDSGYLQGQPDAPTDEEYFGVFVQVENESDETIVIPERFHVLDTLETEYEPIDTDSPYALPLGARLAPGEDLPRPNSTAADGPTQGSLILFRLADESTENRPLELEVPLPSGETGIIELDI